MANPIHGRNGRLYVGLASDTASAEPVANLKSYSLNMTTDRVDVTCFGDQNKKSVAGLPTAEGDFAGYFDTASAQLYTAAQDGLARKFYLYVATGGDYFFGTANFDFSISAAVDGAVEVSGSWSAVSDVKKVDV